MLWPALLTDGPPKAGPGVDPRLLGTVTRTDLPGLPAVQQVTYAGFPLYRFFLDEEPGETDGANLFDPVTSPTGTWYLVDPSRGSPRPVAPASSSRPPRSMAASDATVLAVSMDHGFVLLPDGDFPVYTLSTDRSHGRPEERLRRRLRGGLLAAGPDLRATRGRAGRRSATPWERSPGRTAATR